MGLDTPFIETEINGDGFLGRHDRGSETFTSFFSQSSLIPLHITPSNPIKITDHD